MAVAEALDVAECQDVVPGRRQVAEHNPLLVRRSHVPVAGSRVLHLVLVAGNRVRRSHVLVAGNRVRRSRVPVAGNRVLHLVRRSHVLVAVVHRNRVLHLVLVAGSRVLHLVHHNRVLVAGCFLHLGQSHHGVVPAWGLSLARVLLLPGPDHDHDHDPDLDHDLLRVHRSVRS